MRTYILKPGTPAFVVVDGPCAGRRYDHGVSYREEDLPQAQRASFREVVKPKAKAAPARAETNTDQGGAS